jgi:hypothetical protein
MPFNHKCAPILQAVSAENQLLRSKKENALPCLSNHQCPPTVQRVLQIHNNSTSERRKSCQSSIPSTYSVSSSSK